MIAKGGITMQDYNTIIGSIQMRLNGCQTRSVMDRYKIGSGTLNLIMSRYHANGIPIEELRMMAPKEVEDLFYPQKNIQRKDIPLPDFQYYYDRNQYYIWNVKKWYGVPTASSGKCWRKYMMKMADM